ncbi:hypothetical protein Sste5346_008469 [Sporothrix stenoceras]|uniref:Yippee domain-containing protein n=1 Tax=Sporothrix stenoceras TaxID=5173 RepID=A0ABR3YNV1_9PEZI
MFGRTRVYESRPRPYATFLLPSFPSLNWSRKVSAATSDHPESSQQETIAVQSTLPPNTYHEYVETDSHRFSVASAASSGSTATVTSTGSQATAPSLSTSLSTSPSSDIVTTPQSLFGSPITAPFPIFDSIDYQQPTFAEFENGSETVETGVTSPSTYKSGPQVGTSPKRHQPASPLATTPTAAGSSRRLERLFPTTLRCRRCSADLAFASQIVSKGFTGRHGRAYLVSAPSTSPDHLFAPEVKEVKDEDIPWEDSDDDDEDDDYSRQKFRPGGARDLPNITIGKAENRRLVTGAHVVADISCAVCTTKLGWKYVDASDPAQRYKVGKFILEIARLATHHVWEDVPTGAHAREAGVDESEGGSSSAGEVDGPSPVSDPMGAVRQLMARYQRLRAGNKEINFDEEEGDDDGSHSPADPIEFDSEDDDECEDIFMGTWDADVVARRRAAKRAESLASSFK